MKKIYNLLLFLFRTILLLVVFLSLPLWWPIYVTLRSLPDLWNDELKRIPRFWWENLKEELNK